MLLCVGRRPNSAGLGLEKTKVEIDGHGFLVVDHQRRTADPHILAIGDVAGQPMLAHKASHEGKVAVEALAGQSAAFEPRAIPAVVFTDPEIAWAGLTETEAKGQGRKVEVAQFPWAASGRAQAIGRTEGMTKWVVDPETQQVVGCGIVGFGAGDLISEAVLAIEMGCSVRDVVETIHPHPTLTETLGAAAEVHLGMATDLYRPRKTTRMKDERSGGDRQPGRSSFIPASFSLLPTRGLGPVHRAGPASARRFPARRRSLRAAGWSTATRAASAWPCRSS